MEEIIKYKIPEYLNHEDLKVFCSHDEKIYKVWKEKIEKLDEIYSLFPKNIIELFGEKLFSKGQKIEWDSKWLGSTHYIDRVAFEDLKHNFSYGKDVYGRAFIFVKAMNENVDKFGLVFFQRYTDAQTFVAIETSYEKRPKADAFFSGRCTLDEGFKKIIKQLFEKGEYNFEHNPYCKYFQVKLL